MITNSEAWVEQVAHEWDREAERAGVGNWRNLSSGILLNIAAQHSPRLPSPWPPNNPDVGKVGLRVEAWPHDPGANGEDYHAGHLSAGEAARVLRDLADRCDSWANPECPWAGEEGHAPAPPPVSDDQRRANEAKARAIKEGR